MKRFLLGLIPGFSASLMLFTIPGACAQPGVGFPMVGVAAGQSIRINAVNLGTGAYTEGSSCSVALQLLDSQGQALGQTTVNLKPGTASPLEASHDSLSAGTGRVAVRAVLLYGYSGGANPSQAILAQYDCNIIPSLEVYDNRTRKTRLLLTIATPLPTLSTPVQ